MNIRQEINISAFISRYLHHGKWKMLLSTADQKLASPVSQGGCGWAGLSRGGGVMYFWNENQNGSLKSKEMRIYKGSDSFFYSFMFCKT